jgi:hypothetical protein
MNYRSLIYSKETNREAFDRIARSCQLVKTAQVEGRPQVIIRFEDATNTASIIFNGKTLFENTGEDLWGKTLLEARRLNYRGEFGKNPMFINERIKVDEKTGEASKKRYDITKEVVNMR